MMKRTAIIGGGAAGFFAAINIKEMMPQMDVTIFESSSRVLRKVEVSGGGRCNCTNSFRDVSDLFQVYPRGHRLLKRLFKIFNHQDAYTWFERHGVKLVTQEDQCVFPQSQDSHTIINTFLNEAKRHHIHIITSTKICSLQELSEYDYVVVTTGGSPKEDELRWLEQEIEMPVPSLFTFNINDTNLHSLMGTVAEEATAFIPGTKMHAKGPLLITHWGVSGPAILRLSSHAARLLADNKYQMPLSINWCSKNEEQIREELIKICTDYSQRQITSIHPFNLSSRLWNYLVQKSLGGRGTCRWSELSQKEKNRLTNQILNDNYQITGRSAFKDEFVTCGGIALSAISSSTLESRTHPHLFFAGEVLDIDGVTGGFNFQAAWTTAYIVSQSICNSCFQQ